MKKVKKNKKKKKERRCFFAGAESKSCNEKKREALAVGHVTVIAAVVEHARDVTGESRRSFMQCTNNKRYRSIVRRKKERLLLCVIFSLFIHTREEKGVVGY